MYDNLVDGIEAMILVMQSDYARFMPPTDDIKIKMRNEYNTGIRVKKGSKYIKIITSNSVHSFIVVEDTKGFKKGDILKAASFAAPAMNFARGNVLSGDFRNIRWTGAM